MAVPRLTELIPDRQCVSHVLMPLPGSQDGFSLMIFTQFSACNSGSFAYRGSPSHASSPDIHHS